MRSGTAEVDQRPSFWKVIAIPASQYRVATSGPTDAARPDVDVRRLLKALTPFRSAHDGRAAVELAITVVPLVGLWIAILLLVRAEIWIGLTLAIPAGGFLLRLFLIQHDCGHGAFFRRRAANMWTGRIIGVVTLTPYDFWRRSHARHHAGTGNLDRRGLGDIDTLTVSEYHALSPSRRWRYRLYRNPVVLFGLGPAWQFLLRHRLPAGLPREGWRSWTSVMATNLAIAVLGLGLTYLVGAVPFLLVQLPITLVAATLGLWLFYIQHQFERTVWEPDRRWSFHEAALHGSSHYDLPPVLRWFSANIGAHHVHHLCSTIPFYRMQNVLRAFPELQTLSRLGLRQSFATTRLALWDEDLRRMLSFKDAMRAYASPTAARGR